MQRTIIEKYKDIKTAFFIMNINSRSPIMMQGVKKHERKN